MNLKELAPPIIELPAHQIWYRIQRLKARHDSIRINGFVLPPLGGLTGRFDLTSEATAYVADSELTTLYESLFRRETRTCSWTQLEQRALAAFENRGRLRLTDLRGLEERFPVLQSLRYESTQTFAADCRQSGMDGILYSSAQHPQHGCICLFDAGIRKTRRLALTPLVEPETGRPHNSVVLAAHGSRVPIIRT
jgi:hypothetical protein